MTTTETKKWLEELRRNRKKLYARQNKIINRAMAAAVKMIQDSNEEDKWSLTDDLAQKLISKAKRMRMKPHNRKRKDIFAETNIPTKRAEIDITGKQGILAGDIRVMGKIIEVDGNYAIIMIPKRNIKGWTG